MSAQKRKGDNFERELAAYLQDELNVPAFRAPLSGGGKVGMYGGADVLGVPGLFIEAKRVEKLNFMDAMRQAETNKIKTKCPDVPVVINRRNRMTTGESLVLLRLDDFLIFYAHYLINTGQKRPSNERENHACSAEEREPEG